MPTADYPRKHYNTFRHQKPKPDFIKAVFAVDDALAVQLSTLTGMAADVVREIMVTRSFDGEYEIDFPNADPPRAIDRDRVAAILDEAERELAAMTAMKSEEVLKQLFYCSTSLACLSIRSHSATCPSSSNHSRRITSYFTPATRRF